MHKVTFVVQNLSSFLHLNMGEISSVTADCVSHAILIQYQAH